MLHKRPVASTLVYTMIIFVKSVKLCINCCFCSLQTLRQRPPFCLARFILATFLSINLISTFCTQFYLFALNFNFLHCLGLIDVLSANELAEIFACVLLGKILNMREKGLLGYLGVTILHSVDVVRQ